VKLLFDTHLLLWAAEDSPRLPKAVARLIDDSKNELLFSVASVWEIAIKHGVGRGVVSIDPRRLRRNLLDNGYSELAITSEHAVAIDALPSYHKDPFDRLLIAQATVEGITLLTVDKIVARYPGPIQRV
jgi:PIN domain nuclease of toxin-antitoxin system